MAQSALVIGGNQYLAQRARQAGAPQVAVLPTVLDIDRYCCKEYPVFKSPGDNGSQAAAELPCIVWIGSPSTAAYLENLKPVLTRVAQQHRFRLRIIGGLPLTITGVPVDCLAWSEATEAQWLRSADIGIMPLTDTQWERGKCGYKLIQYMASGLPVVASAVGANQDIVLDDVNGYLASTPEQWSEALGRLLASPALRARLGLAGRQRVEARYCVQQVWPTLASLLQRAGEKKASP
jgi:glycosyltransferase involved in cell wall biosynthesis